MSRLLLAFAATTAIVLTGCTSASYDLMETAAVHKQKFQDLDPQDFGTNHPGRHQIHGIDVSKWNGNVDWQTAKRSGVSFVFIKATEGKDMIDPTFEASWKGAAAAGIPHAPYHFYYFCSTPDEQADWFIQNVPKSASLLPPVIDVEWNPASPTCKTRPAPEQVRAVMQRFMDRLEAHYGKKPIIYTSVDFHRDNLVGHFQNYPFWVRSVAAHPQKIYDSRRWAFWQYTSTGVVPGVPGKTDINAFSGSEKNWLAWVASVSK